MMKMNVMHDDSVRFEHVLFGLSVRALLRVTFGYYLMLCLDLLVLL